jgi:diguanylate cyclase (GGDEF)-like protein
MTFDISTLAIARAIVAFAGGLVLLMNWWHDRAVWAAFWWGVVGCGTGVGIALLAMHAVLPDWATGMVGPLILDLCGALTWAAARIFTRGSVKPLVVIAGMGGWMALLIVAATFASKQHAIALGVAITACLYCAAAVQFWLGRAEKLRGRWAMISLLVLQSIALLLASIQYATSRLTLPTVGWFGIIHFVGLIYVGGAAIFLTMMLNERREIKYKAAALIDPLTGLANRRAFLERAQQMLDRSLRDDVPISLIAVDLDRFKNVNDAFGHQVGDHVLRIFADVLSRVLRPADIAGRMGGEEFVAVLPGCGIEAALVVARRIRSAFQDDARFVGGHRVEATLSAGVACAPEHGDGLTEIMARADAAMYAAKDQGRNRVMRAEPYSSDPQSATVIRIA